MDTNRYSQIEFIASGGFARVYRAVDNFTARTVAIKQLINPTPELLGRLKRERDMLTIHRDNPFVVDILDSRLDGPNSFLVLEYSSLGSLQKYVANRRGWRRIAGWLFDIAYGLTLIHERGDFVRDVKPSNLLRFKRPDGSDLIKIADFGLAQRPDNPFERMTTSVFGTKGYIDPVALKTGTFTSASDIYSLGITMTELLTGFKHFWSPISCPPEFRALITSMNDQNASNRPSARRVLERVKAILEAPSASPSQPANVDGLGWILAGGALLAGVYLMTKAK